MSALAPQKSSRIADEQEWLEASEHVESAPASVWVSDYEEEEETTRQGKRVGDQNIDSNSPHSEQEELVDTPRPIRILDESQVLPGEASFATVRLNQPIEESVIRQDYWESISPSTVGDYRERRSASRIQILDESQVLAAEASFATVMSEERVQRHSPIREFLVKTKLSLNQFVLAISALVSVLALAVIVLLNTRSSEVVTTTSAPPPPTVDSASQSLPTTASSQSLLISNSQGDVSGGVSPTDAVETVEATAEFAEATLNETPSANDSRPALSDARSGATRPDVLLEVNSVGARTHSPKPRVVETKKQSAADGRTAMKEPAVVKTSNASVKTGPPEARPEAATKQSEAPATMESVEIKTPPTGGGVRPRTVTRKPSP